MSDAWSSHALASASISTPRATFIWAVKRRARSHEPLNGSCCFFIALSADLSRKRSSLPDQATRLIVCHVISASWVYRETYGSMA